MQKVDISVGNLVDMVKAGDLVLPEMQRRPRPSPSPPTKEELAA